MAKAGCSGSEVAGWLGAEAQLLSKPAPASAQAISDFCINDVGFAGLSFGFTIIDPPYRASAYRNRHDEKVNDRYASEQRYSTA